MQKELPQNQSPEAETSNPPQDQITALVNLYGSGQLTKTEHACRDLLQIYPQSLVVINVLGGVLVGQGKLKESIQAFDKAIQLKPDFAPAYSNRGAALQNLGRLDEALQNCDKAIQLKPDFADAYYNRGLTLKELGRLNEALQNYDKAIQLKSDYVDAHYNRGLTLVRLGQLQEALTSYDKAIELKPDFADAYNNRGNVLLGLGQSHEAMASYNKAIEFKPDFAEPQYNRHALLLNPDDLMPAIQCMEKAIDIDPLNTLYRFVLGMLWDYSGDTQEAMTHFDMVESGESLYRANLDAWRYIKSANKKVPAIIGSNIHAFKLGIEAAVVDGLVLEFGVRFGTSIRQISTLVGQDVYGFDSFQGLPESWHSEAKGSYSTKGVIPSVPQNVILHDGWFEETLPGFVQQHPEPVRFMNIDCDLYTSTKTVLQIFAKQIIPGTVIVFDEYIGNEHWREDEFKAFQEAVLKYGWKYEYLCFSFMTGQVVVRIN
ncbi:MAG: tetratricopeptide repeat protein [Pseudohongiellaceae bacterium]